MVVGGGVEVGVGGGVEVGVGEWVEVRVGGWVEVRVGGWVEGEWVMCAYHTNYKSAVQSAGARLALCTGM